MWRTSVTQLAARPVVAGVVGEVLIASSSSSQLCLHKGYQEHQQEEQDDGAHEKD